MANSSSHHPDPAAAFDPHAITIAKRQYFQAGDDSLEHMFRRVANWVAKPDRQDRRPSVHVMISSRPAAQLAGKGTLRQRSTASYRTADPKSGTSSSATSPPSSPWSARWAGQRVPRPLGPSAASAAVGGSPHHRPQHADYEGAPAFWTSCASITRGYATRGRGTNVSPCGGGDSTTSGAYGRHGQGPRRPGVLVDLSDLRRKARPWRVRRTPAGPRRSVEWHFAMGRARWRGFAGPVARCGTSSSSGSVRAAASIRTAGQHQPRHLGSN